MQPPARNARLPTQMRQPPARQKKVDVPAAVNGAWQLKQTIFSSHRHGDVHTGLGQRGQGPRQFRRAFPAKTYLSHDGLRRSCSFGISVSRRQEERDDIKLLEKKKKKQHCRGTVDTSTRAVACALTSKPQLLLLLHSTRAVACTVKKPVEVISPATLCSWICGTGTVRLSAPRAPATFNSFGNPLHATSLFRHSRRN